MFVRGLGATASSVEALAMQFEISEPGLLVTGFNLI